MFTPRRSLSYHLIWLLCCIALIISLFITRLAYLQIIHTDSFFDQSQRNFLRFEKIVSPRGNIVDCNGLLLATNRPIVTIMWHGTGNNILSTQQKDVLILLETILNLTLLDDSLMIDKIMYAERYHQQIILQEDISFEQLGKIEELLSHDANIKIIKDFKRYYPYSSYACHVLGYLGYVDIERIGKMGLEKIFEESLKGNNGTLINTINSFGRKLAQKEGVKARPGDNLHITIDIKIQDIVERIFPESLGGTFIVMNPKDGAIKALVSRPNFDPTIFLAPMTPDLWSELQQKKPFINRAFGASYPPGSIFKLVTVSAALEHNIIDQNDEFNCRGFVSFADRKYFCHNKNGHGRLNTQQAVALSCNTLFYEIGKKISIDTLADYAHRFGLGVKTNVPFNELTGLIPSRRWKEEAKGERWWPGETLSAAIGQSFLLVTPIQIATMISSIFTGQLVKPRLLCDEPIEQKPLQIRPATRDLLQQSMRSAVTMGTGRSITRIKDMNVYAKTSTAQTSALHKRLLGSEYLEHGWCVAYFTYKHHTPLTLVILIENIGSSRPTTIVAKEFLLEYKKILDKEE